MTCRLCCSRARALSHMCVHQFFGCRDRAPGSPCQCGMFNPKSATRFFKKLSVTTSHFHPKKHHHNQAPTRSEPHVHSPALLLPRPGSGLLLPRWRTFNPKSATFFGDQLPVARWRLHPEKHLQNQAPTCSEPHVRSPALLLPRPGSGLILQRWHV